jgi:hypothetical protein
MSRFIHVPAIVVLLAAACSGVAKPMPASSRRWFGPRTVIAGYSTWYLFNIDWEIPVTCDPATSRCDTGDYTFKGGETVNFYSTGTPPQGIWTLYSLNWAPYAVCDVQGTTFALHRKDCSGPVETFTTRGTGTHYVTFIQTGSVYPKNVYVSAVSGFPQNAQLTWWKYAYGCAVTKAQLAGTTPFSFRGTDALCLQVSVPDTAIAGDYTVSITFSETPSGGNSTVLQFPITVVHIPPLRTQPIDWTTVPPIPGLARWEQTMVSPNGGGAQWCPDKANPTEKMAFGYEAQVWFYDGARVYYQIANYTGDQQWANCARNIESQYSDYILNNKGSIPMWRIFPKGLEMSMCPSCDPKYAAALRALINGTLYTKTAGYPWDGVIREMAFTLDLEVAQQTAFGEPHKNLTSTADMEIGFLLAYTDGTGRYGMYQTFMTGLAMESLIGYWDLTHDPRVPYAIRRMLDDIWARYNTNNHAMMYNADVDPAKCNETPAWYVPLPGGNCGLNSHQGINNFVAPAFAWYWRQAGDTTYLTRGDDLFAHSLDEPIYAGKQFSQNYRWSFDYVKWRSKP